MKKLAISAVAFFAAAALIVAIIVPIMLGGLAKKLLSDPLCTLASSLVRPSVPHDGSTISIGDSGLELSKAQLDNAAAIFTIAQAMKSSTENSWDLDEFIKFGFWVAIQETKIQNLGWQGDRQDHNSLGIYAQQFGMVNANGIEYWGTPQQLTNVVYAIRRFYQEVLKKVPDPSGKTPLDIAIEVQNPSKEAYLSDDNYFPGWEDEAEQLLELFRSIETPDEDTDGTALQPDESTAIAVVGDSITVQSNRFLFDDLQSAGYTDIRVDAQGARSVRIDTSETFVPTTSGDTPNLGDDQVLVSGLTAIRNLRRTGFDPQDWVILLGTNDLGQVSSEPAQGAADVASIIDDVMLELGPDKRVLWLTVWSEAKPAEAELFNQTLMVSTSRYDNLTVGDWASAVRSNPTWLADAVHYTEEGNQNRSSFIGKALGFTFKAAGIGAKVVSPINVFGGLLPSCNPGSNVGPQTIRRPALGTPIENLYNPEIARVARYFEQILSIELKYGAPRQKWYDMGRKGNFGHGSKQQWLSDIYLSDNYQSADCSGLVNLVLYLVYGVDYNGCSHSYRELVLDGQQVTAPVMEKGIDITLLQAGDFIIKHNQGCLGGDMMNHIVIVVEVNLEKGEIMTAESSAGEDGYALVTKSVDWYNSNWQDLVVSRWIGPGAQTLSVEPTPSTTSNSTLERADDLDGVYQRGLNPHN